MKNAEEKNRSHGGSRLNRSETVTIRLDPKLNYLCELAARAQKRTKSNFIEWAIEQSLKEVVLGYFDYKDPNTGESYPAPIKLNETISNLFWDPYEADRLVRLVYYYSPLLTHLDSLIWKLISSKEVFWQIDNVTLEDNLFDVSGNGKIINLEAVRKHWNTLKKVAQGELPETDLDNLEPFDDIDSKKQLYSIRKLVGEIKKDVAGISTDKEKLREAQSNNRVKRLSSSYESSSDEANYFEYFSDDEEV